MARAAIGTQDDAAIVDAVLASAAFQRAPVLSKLLSYLWKHRAEAPGEYAIALDVFGKRPEFDPKLDATVRVQVARLRQKLREYFECDGRELAFELSIPAGGHRLELLPRATEAPAKRAWNPAIVALSVVCLVLAAAVIGLAWDRARLKAITPPPELPAFWKRTLLNGRPTRLVFATPVFFQRDRLRVRDVDINDAEAFAESEALRPIFPKKPAVSTSYSVTSDTVALAMLARLLSASGVPVTISATQDLSLELFGSDNIVFLGIPPTSQHVAGLLAQTGFYLAPRNQMVCVRQPQGGEPARFERPANPAVRYGIVSVLPGQAPGTKLVLLSGMHTASLASFLASPVTLQSLENFLAKQGTPEHFEMVVAAEVDGVKMLKASPVAFRSVSPNLWKQNVTSK